MFTAGTAILFCFFANIFWFNTELLGIDLQKWNRFESCSGVFCYINASFRNMHIGYVYPIYFREERVDIGVQECGFRPLGFSDYNYLEKEPYSLTPLISCMPTTAKENPNITDCISTSEKYRRLLVQNGNNCVFILRRGRKTEVETTESAPLSTDAMTTTPTSEGEIYWIDTELVDSANDTFIQLWQSAKTCSGIICQRENITVYFREKREHLSRECISEYLLRDKKFFSDLSEVRHIVVYRTFKVTCVPMTIGDTATIDECDRRLAMHNRFDKNKTHCVSTSQKRRIYTEKFA